MFVLVEMGNLADCFIKVCYSNKKSVEKTSYKSLDVERTRIDVDDETM